MAKYRLCKAKCTCRAEPTAYAKCLVSAHLKSWGERFDSLLNVQRLDQRGSIECRDKYKSLRDAARFELRELMAAWDLRVREKLNTVAKRGADTVLCSKVDADTAMNNASADAEHLNAAEPVFPSRRNAIHMDLVNLHA